MTLSSPEKADIVALDAADSPVLVAELEPDRPSDSGAVERLEALVREAHPPADYGLLVDPDRLRLYRWTPAGLGSPILDEPTSAVLSRYEQRYGSKRIYYDYFVVLVEAWLRDVAYHWKSERPPFFDELVQEGFAARLRGGTTRARFLYQE